MSILEKLNAVKDTVPHYWPIGSFIHHNPLKGFEDLHFKEAVKEAQAIFGGKVYMDPEYFLGLKAEGKIKGDIFDANLQEVLEKQSLGLDIDAAKKFLLEVSPEWERLRTCTLQTDEAIDETLMAHVESAAHYDDKVAWIADLTKYMTLYELNDALFGSEIKEPMDKDIIEFVSRFVDEEQTTMGMPNRELGMFEAFKLFEGLNYAKDAESFVEEALERLKVEDIEGYLLTHILKLHGWAGFLKYRSEDPDYASQQRYPSSLIEYMAIRLYYEVEYLKERSLSDFGQLATYIAEDSSTVLVKLLKHKQKFSGQCLDDIEAGISSEKILEKYVFNQLKVSCLLIQHTREVLKSDLPLVELSEVVERLRSEEGYIWLKSLEDTYIHTYAESFTQEQPKAVEKPLASATFCLDVRSEIMRRTLESVGAYETYGAGGFLGLPIAFVEFDKAHELFLAPAIVKPQNVVFEIPKESYEEYKSKKGVTKTTKTILNDLKNNPYTPYIMVEAIGWLFGINLFGKTFLPQKTKKLFSKIKPQKPKTTYTLDKLSTKEIDFYVKKLHAKIIFKFLHSRLGIEYSKPEIELVWRHLIFGEDLKLKIADEVIAKLKSEYQITPEDYEYQKQKLTMVGFTLEEKVSYLHNYLTMIGQVENFPEFVTIIGHGSISDNNPFESALDCGACGGSVSLPNARALCMIANSKDVRAKLQEKGVVIPEETIFIPGLHITTTDEITFYDTDLLVGEQVERFAKVQEDFNQASFLSRDERTRALPYTHSQKDIWIKSMDWSEPRPEWGLAKNMGVFAGPRESIKHIAFDNRLFMHSYDWTIDNDEAEILTRIFNGPLIVGEWINLEHYFSTVDNHVYGAGSKVYHNVVSKIGVYCGNYSDLKIGLPTQSVFLEGEAFHEPVRLLTFMEAPLEKVLKAVEKSIAQPFILNEWIRPVVIDKVAKKVYSFEAGEFKVIKELA